MANSHDYLEFYYYYEDSNYAYGTRTTFLDAFLPTNTDTTVNFYGRTKEGSNYIYFYQQDADGNGYTLKNTVSVSAN